MAQEFTRRGVIGAGLAAAGAVTAGTSPQGAAQARLIIRPNQLLNYLPGDYCGFSIEQATLEDADLYRAGNRSLVALFRRLTVGGVLRIGGNSSEYCWWKARPDSVQPVARTTGQGRADNWMPQRFHPITPRAIDNLRTFLDATGWRCIYGLNLGTGSPARDAEEAAYVARALGTRLLYFQIGNEPDLYRRPNNRVRPAGWDFPDYLREWVAIARAVLARVPNARFGGPDVASSADWVVRFPREAKPLMGDRLVALTGHYYAAGPPDSAKVTIRNLLATDPRVASTMRAIMPAARASGLEYRMSEGNSCYRGGKAGMSNAFASALWGMDYMLDMGARGCTGINFHGGGGNVITSALGGKLPGARDARDVALAQLGTFYSPIAGNPTQGYSARPLFYGMMAAEMFADTELVATELDAGGANLKAYAGRAAGRAGERDAWRIALINKDLARDALVAVELPPGVQRGTLWRLTGPAVDATDGTRFADATVAPGSARWTPRPERIAAARGPLLLDVRRTSAVVLQLG